MLREADVDWHARRSVMKQQDEVVLSETFGVFDSRGQPLPRGESDEFTYRFDARGDRGVDVDRRPCEPARDNGDTSDDRGGASSGFEKAGDRRERF